MPLNWYLEGLSWYLEALKKYAVFSGRARRKEFWWFYLFNMLAILTFSVVDHFMRTNIEGLQIGVLTAIYSLAIATGCLGEKTARHRLKRLVGSLRSDRPGYDRIARFDASKKPAGSKRVRSLATDETPRDAA
jgi:uncharacterized protein DUF805